MKRKILFLLILFFHGQCWCRPQKEESSREFFFQSQCSGEEDVYVDFQNCLEGLGEKVDTSFDLRMEDAGEDKVCCPKSKILGSQTAVANTKCEDNEGFSCVRHSNCISNEILSDDEQRVLKVIVSQSSIKRLEINPKTSKCKSDLEVCCKKSKEELKAGNRTKPMMDKEDFLSFPSEKFKSRCGRHNVDGIDIRIEESIEGSSATQFGEWPHTCILFNKNGSKLDDGEFSPRIGINVDELLIGGASLITPGIILTAAHKVDGKSPDDLIVRCGVWDFKHEDEEHPSQQRGISSITIHPAFHKKMVYNDFALLHLTEEFVLKNHLDTICLPQTPNDLGEEFDTRGCFATGFGKDKFDGQYQRAMKQVKIPMVQHQDCEKRLQTQKSASFRLHESFVCAGGAPKGGDTCEGDGGGPLVCPVKGTDGDRYVQVGITAWGVKCNTPNIPGVYASVPYDLCFIDWATKCKEGKKYNSYYNIESCRGWIDLEFERLDKEKSEAEEKLRGGGLTEDEKEKLEDDLKRVSQYIENAESLADSCGR